MRFAQLNYSFAVAKFAFGELNLIFTYIQNHNGLLTETPAAFLLEL